MRPLWSLRCPGREWLDEFLAAESQRDFTYAAIGATNGDVSPPGFNHDHNRVLLGRGEKAFQSACEALRHWQQFPRPWTQIYPPATPLEIGITVAVVIRVFGLWRLNSARIVYTIEESSPIQRFGFAYGTLPAHAECGEERFLIERDANNDVWYDLRSFSKPRSWIARIGYPITRRLQHRFVRHSQVAMRAAVISGSLR